MGTCVNCKSAGRPTYKSPCSECKGYSKYEAVEIRTNADRIRAMSDEELEASIISVHLGYCPWCNRNCEYNGEHGCDTCISNWLKQPAEENAND